MNREKIEMSWFGWSKTSTIHNFPNQMSLTIKELAALAEEARAAVARAAAATRLRIGKLTADLYASQTRNEELSDYIADLQRDFNDQAAALEAAQIRIKELETGCAVLPLKIVR